MPPDALLALVSGIPLVILGAALLALTPRRREQVFFGFFALLWGTQIATANIGIVLDDARVHRTWLLVSFGFYVPAWLFLVRFASLTRVQRWTRALSWIFSAHAIIAGLVLVARPEVVVASVNGGGGVPLSTRFGPLSFVLMHGPFFIAFYLLIGILYREYRSSQVGTQRHRIRGLLIASLLYTSYVTVRQLLYFVSGPITVQVSGPIGPLGIAAFFTGGTVFLATIFFHLLVRPPPPEERDRNLLLSFVVPAGGAAIEGVFAAVGYPFESLGFWRLATVVVLVYSLARHQLFDLDLRLRPFAVPGIAAACMMVGGVSIASVPFTGGSFRDVTTVVVLATAGATSAVVFRHRLTDILFPGVQDSPDYVRRRKLEVYRGALEEAVVAGHEDTDVLRRLRRDLGISSREHEAMAFMARIRAPTPLPVPQAARVEPGALVAARYRIDRLLGEGGYGRAFLARDEREGRPVVVKTVANAALGGNAAAALAREARMLREIRHPNVIGVLDVQETPHETLLVLEFADGGSLAGLLARRGALGFDEARRITDGILSGLEAAHARGIVHRDVKPENVLLMRDGTVKIADFGIAREDRPDATGVTGAAGAGTLLYMAPEQVRGRAVDARADLYAAGVVFHLLLAGRFYLKIAGKDDFQVRQLILQADPHLALKETPAWVEPFLLRALAKEPDERFASAAAMRAALAAGVVETRPVASS